MADPGAFYCDIVYYCMAAVGILFILSPTPSEISIAMIKTGAHCKTRRPGKNAREIQYIRSHLRGWIG